MHVAAHTCEYSAGVSQILLSHRMTTGKGKSEETAVNVGQEVSHHMICVRLLTNISLSLTHIQSYSVT